MGNAEPGRHLDDLLRRAHNGFELEKELADRLRSSGLMWHTQLHSFRQRKGLPHGLCRRTLRHACLLADGDDVVLWEVEHNTDPGGRQSYQIYADPEAMAEAVRLIDSRFGDPTPDELDAETLDFLSRLPELEIADSAVPPRAYVWDQEGAADHAFRLLRRAANSDAPATEAQAPLDGAIAYDIMYVTSRHSRIGEGDGDARIAGWTLYEHTFLMADGSETSLWEVEHTMTPGGLPVCEVYADRLSACDAADVRLDRLERK